MSNTAEARIVGMLEVLLRKVAALELKRPPLTRQQFAEATGYSYRQITRKIAAREIRLKDGRIPASELEKFLS
jgi:hypothetical protein